MTTELVERPVVGEVWVHEEGTGPLSYVGTAADTLEKVVVKRITGYSDKGEVAYVVWFYGMNGIKHGAMLDDFLKAYRRENPK